MNDFNTAQDFYNKNHLFRMEDRIFWDKYLGTKAKYSDNVRTLIHYRLTNRQENPVEMSTESYEFNPTTTNIHVLRQYIELRIKNYNEEPAEKERQRLNKIINIHNLRANDSSQLIKKIIK